MQIIKPHEKIWIFNNLIENPEEIIEYYENKSEWEKWWVFGWVTTINIGRNVFEKFPTKEEWNKTFFIHQEKENFQILNKILDPFYETTNLFFKENNILLEDYIFKSFSIAKWNKAQELGHHTDYMQERSLIPEDKFDTTVLFYLNEDFDGGEISFIELDENLEIKWFYEHKPKAGDVVVFSTRHPIYHGVNPINSGRRYMIRTYWHTTQKPDKKWEEGIVKYGEEEWKKIQEEKSKKLRNEENIYKYYKGRKFNIQYLDQKLFKD